DAIAALVRELQRLHELGLELGGDALELDELGAADEIGTDGRMTAHAMLTALEVDLPGAVLAVLLVLAGSLAELAVTARHLGHHLRLEALELLAVAQVALGELRIRELGDDAAIRALVELHAQPARRVDALDDVDERLAGELGLVRAIAT